MAPTLGSSHGHGGVGKERLFIASFQEDLGQAKHVVFTESHIRDRLTEIAGLMPSFIAKAPKARGAYVRSHTRLKTVMFP